jgi:hypothetical protein
MLIDLSGNLELALEKFSSFMEAVVGLRQERDWFQTFLGLKVFPLDLKPEEIDIRDIAHSLAMQCRFNGHTRKFYSVAHHSVLVSYYLPHILAREGLMHDATEAYLHDVVRPIKHHPAMVFYRRAEARAEKAIWKRFGLAPLSVEDEALVKLVDNRVLMTEKRDLLKSKEINRWSIKAEPYHGIIDPWNPDRSEYEFFRRAFELGLTDDSDHLAALESAMPESLFIGRKKVSYDH